jgi:hypothetical protein
MSPARRLPLVKVIWGTFALPWMYREAWFRAIRLPLLALGAVSLLWDVFDSTTSPVELAVWYTGYLAATSWLAVRCHRLVLMDPVVLATSSPAGAMRAVGIYLATVALLWVIWLVITALLAAIVVSAWLMFKSGGVAPAGSPPPAFDPAIQAGIAPLTMLSALPGAWLVARLSPLLPAIALEQRWRLRDAWELSAGNGWRLAIVVIALPYGFTLLGNLLARDGASTFESAALALALAILTSLEIIALSLSYRELERSEPPPTDPPG